MYIIITSLHFPFAFSTTWPRGDVEPDRGVRHEPSADLLRAQHDEGVPPGPRPADQGQQPARAGPVGGAGQDGGCRQGGEPTHDIILLKSKLNFRTAQ